LFKNKTILITGGTGSLGQALTKRLLKMDANTIRIFSRNESKQIEMEDDIKDDRLRFFIGDVRDSHRLSKAVEGADFVFHTAALKHVPKIEYNPFEAIKTNVVGSQNVIEASLGANVDKVVCVGTDKAVSPLNTYGATKLLAEKLFVSANNYLDKEKYRTKFFAVRYGNVLGSSGSVIPLFIKQIKSKQKITITNPNMTRFSLTMSEALDFILHATDIGKGSEIFIPKLRSYSITDVKSVLGEILENTGEEEIGIRPGEKLHEVLINTDEMKYVWEINDTYMIINPLYHKFFDDDVKIRYPNAKKIESMKIYSSENVEKISPIDLKNIILDSNLL
jgi:UDP-N-acetylglucosamine 4,6-dehydratase/UDP-glucose 4-epimerase